MSSHAYSLSSLAEALPCPTTDRAPRRRVVVTGVGAVTPLGNDAPSTWEAVVAGRSGIGPLTRVDSSCFEAGVAAEVRGFDPSGVADRKERRYLDDFCLFALAAAAEALADAGWLSDPAARDRTAVVMGSGYGGLTAFERGYEVLRSRGPGKVGPHVIPAGMANSAAAHLAQRFQLRGPNHTVMTACAAGGHAIGTAFRIVASGEADAALTGGADSAIGPGRP